MTRKPLHHHCAAFNSKPSEIAAAIRLHYVSTALTSYKNPMQRASVDHPTRTLLATSHTSTSIPTPNRRWSTLTQTGLMFALRPSSPLLSPYHAQHSNSLASPLHTPISPSTSSTASTATSQSPRPLRTPSFTPLVSPLLGPVYNPAKKRQLAVDPIQIPIDTPAKRLRLSPPSPCPSTPLQVSFRTPLDSTFKGTTPRAAPTAPTIVLPPVPTRDTSTTRTMDASFNLAPSPQRLDGHSRHHSSPATVDYTDATDQTPFTGSSRRTASPTSLPSLMAMKRSNPKRLSLTLTMPSSSTEHLPPIDPGSATPTMSTSNASSTSTPYTPGPPKTPALAMTASLGRATGKRRPSLLNLVTQQTSLEQIPPTPGGGFHYAAPSRPRIRARSSTAAEVTNHYAHQSSEKEYRSAHPSYRSFPPIVEHDTAIPSPSFGNSYQASSSPSTSPHTSPRTSQSGSTASTPSSSPPLPDVNGFSTAVYGHRPVEPYADCPVEVIPNVFLGAESSASDLTWAAGRFERIRIVNVAQEIENPFAGPGSAKGKEKEKIAFGRYAGENGYPEVEYCHLRWSHGEGGLAQLPSGSSLDDLMNGHEADTDASSWGLWNAVKWLEGARRQGTPVLIHCQCGISRSATLLIAYLMSLAVAGLAPDHLGHLKGMQETYDMVKNKSPCIGPNVSLVFQLVEFQRALTSLLSDYVARPNQIPPNTSFPTLAEQALSEAEWAKRRAEFEDEGSDEEMMKGVGGLLASPISPEEAGDEARALDEAMRVRLRARE